MCRVIEINENTNLDEAMKPLAIWRFALEIKNKRDLKYYSKCLQQDFGFSKKESEEALIKQLKCNIESAKEAVK